MTQNKYKLLVTDIDGTLVGKAGIISQADIEALQRAGKTGIRVSFSTGRVVMAAQRFIDLIGLDGYHVFFDGAFVYSPENKDEVFIDPLPAGMVEEIIGYSRKAGLDFDFYSSTRFFAEKETWATEIRRTFFKIEPTIIGFDDIWEKERLIKGTLVVESPEEKEKAREFTETFRERLRFSPTQTPAYPGIDFINILSPSVSKGKALEALASFLGINLAEVMAVGDGANDLSLLETAGLAVAMGNSPDSLKGIADFVTLDVDNSGVAAAVEKFLL